MTENDLKELNFDKIVVTTKESNNEKGYYYYELLIRPGLHLGSTDSDETIDDNWKVKNWDSTAAIFATEEGIIELTRISQYNRQ